MTHIITPLELKHLSRLQVVRVNKDATGLYEWIEIQQEGVRNMETRYLKTLLTVLESGSFSRAASDLSVTQSAVSQRIKFVEDHYGLSLIDRSGSVIVATEAGKAVIRKARQILSLETELDDELNGLKTISRLSICCTPTFGSVYLPLVLSQFFLTKSDGVKIKCSLNTPEKALKGVLERESDVAIIEHCGNLTILDIDLVRLPPDEMVIISSPTLGLSGRELSISELIKQRLIVRREGCSSRGLFEENLSKYGKNLDDFHGVVTHEDLYLSIQTTLAGQGVAFVSKSLVMEHLEKGTLLEHSVEGFTSSRSRSIIINRNRSENAFVKEFVECVHKVFE